MKKAKYSEIQQKRQVLTTSKLLPVTVSWRNGKDNHLPSDKNFARKQITRRTEDFYADIKDDIESKFDTSDYSKDHPLFSTKNKKVIGMFKDCLLYTSPSPRDS